MNLIKLSNGWTIYFSNGVYNSSLALYTLRHSVVAPTVVGLYNDAVQMGSNQTLTLPAIAEPVKISTVLGGKKFYLGVKNVDAVSKYILVNEVLAEVE